MTCDIIFSAILQEGDTETENPFDIDVMKEAIPEEPEEEDKGKENNRDGLDVSSDEEEDGGDDTDLKNSEENQVTKFLTFLFICTVFFKQ